MVVNRPCDVDELAVYASRDAAVVVKYLGAGAPTYSPWNTLLTPMLLLTCTPYVSWLPAVAVSTAAGSVHVTLVLLTNVVVAHVTPPTDTAASNVNQSPVRVRG